MHLKPYFGNNICTVDNSSNKLIPMKPQLLTLKIKSSAFKLKNVCYDREFFV